ncbi:hypothetical protein FRC07_015003 [Ceratobasidium sp. 392]|nr:hypothetical protein FRC07_015003 [Ceratobasidium sp. 392]
METANLQPTQSTVDKQAVAFNEGSAGSTSHPPGYYTDGPGHSQQAPGYLQQAREALISAAGTVQNAMGIETPASTMRGLAENTKIDASMPSSENTGAAPGERVGGVGALPGNASEEGVARLPAERTSVPSREYEGTYPGEKTGGVGALPGKFNESGVALLPDERAAEAKAGVESSAFAAAHPSSENPDKTDLKTAAAHPIETAKQARRGSTSSSSSEEEGDGTADQPRRKKSLKDKLTGTVKLATGKVMKDENMIAQGQSLRGH